MLDCGSGQHAKRRGHRQQDAGQQMDVAEEAVPHRCKQGDADNRRHARSRGEPGQEAEEQDQEWNDHGAPANAENSAEGTGSNCDRGELENFLFSPGGHRRDTSVMSPSADIDRLNQVLDHLRADPARTAILSDIDGTLAPIVEQPDQVAIHPEAPDILRKLRDRYALVACVSGRRAGEARDIVGVEGLTYSGNHGMEILDPETHEVRFELNLRGHADAAASFVDNLDDVRLQRAGLRLEDKGPIQALHWRGADDEARAAAVAHEIAEEAALAGLEPHWGRKVLEIRPVGVGGKGAAIANLLREAGVEIAVYAGDDRTDIEAFRTLREFHGESETLKAVYCMGIYSPEGPPGLQEHSDLLLDSTDHWVEVLAELTS